MTSCNEHLAQPSSIIIILFFYVLFYNVNNPREYQQTDHIIIVAS